VKGPQPPCSKDISVLTATRLSAAFPYVAPAARADVDGPGVHIVDGGYYDNYGTSSLVEWLDYKLSDGSGIQNVLIVLIHGAPTVQREQKGLRTVRNAMFTAELHADGFINFTRR
jgi:hypothetical protein